MWENHSTNMFWKSVVWRHKSLKLAEGKEKPQMLVYRLAVIETHLGEEI